jgi:hypothetical protein
MKNSNLLSLSLAIFGISSTSLSAQSWLYTEYYPWVWSAEQGWMVAEEDYAEFYRYPGGEMVIFGEDTNHNNSLELLDGMQWTLSWEDETGSRTTTVEYVADYDSWGEVLVVEQPLLDNFNNTGLLLLGNLQDFTLEDGSLLIVGGVLSNFASTLTFTLTGENTGSFEVEDESVDAYRTGTFTVEVLPPAERFSGF